MTIKIFLESEVDGLNEYLKEHIPLENGGIVHKDGKVIVTTREDGKWGLGRRDMQLTVETGLADVQKNLLSHTAELWFIQSKRLENTGSKDQRMELDQKISLIERSIENDKTQIRQYRDLIKDIGEGKFD